jgi:putative ABC transport system permease protein
MRFTDILAIAFSALYQQKVRTLLTMAGVVIGTLALVVSVSLGRGFEEEVMRQLNRGSFTRQIAVWPGTGVREDAIPPERLYVNAAMSAAKRERIRQAIIHRWPVGRREIQLRPDRVRSLADIPHVRAVVPFVQKLCQVQIQGRAPAIVLAFAAGADNLHFRNRIVAGDYFSSDRERSVVVSEYLLYLWGLGDDDDVEAAVGKKLRLEFPPYRLYGGLLGAGPAGPLAMVTALHLPTGASLALPGVVSEEFTIVGVLREFVEDQDGNDVFDLGAGVRSWRADVFLPSGTASELFARGPLATRFGYLGVTVIVDEERNLKEVSRRIRSRGLHDYSLLEFIQGVRTNLVLVTFVTAFLAAVALLVAALGITNTMIMAVLERTREIGVMKAVGARDHHIQMMFLVEGALIGLIGGTLGVLLGWAASIPGDSVARSLLQDQALPTLRHTLFAFPLWLTLGTPAFAGLVTTLAAVYPARRATRVNPITALRHE